MIKAQVIIYSFQACMTKLLIYSFIFFIKKTNTEI